MENRENKNPTTGSESDISKSQQNQQPAASHSDRQPQEGERNQTEFGQSQQSPAGQSDQSSTAQSGFGETATQQRSDVEGSSLGQQPRTEAESGFVGSQGSQDSSSELVNKEDEQSFRKDGQGAPEGK